jgi:DNA-binding transcriptional regulator YhcF (GntR family)
MERTAPDAGGFAQAGTRLLPGAERTLAEQLAAWLRRRIDEHALKPGTRRPSIRRFAQQQRVSRSTVVEAYDRLIAAGEVESRRGSGFYVRARRSDRAPAKTARTARAAVQPPISAATPTRSRWRPAARTSSARPAACSRRHNCRARGCGCPQPRA